MKLCPRIFTLICFSILTTALFSQQLYMPRDVQQAFKKGTRSADGMPGKNYWQNTGRYTISITAMPPAREIKGEETIIYKNNSPDTIKTPSIKLFLNIHKPGAPRNRGAHDEYLTSGMHIDGVTHNGNSVAWKDHPDRFTVSSLRLPKPLAPKDSMTLTFKWHFDISVESGREGAIDSTTFFLAYFYPRIAVYDDYNGWDRTNFMDSHEFYSDFNDYNVTVTVPKNYIVWGTGTLQHPEKLLQPEILKRYNASFTSDETIQVATKADLDAKKVTTQNDMNSWQFIAKKIPDMAFGISDHYLWDAGSVVVDDATKRRASTQAAYLEKAVDYKKMVEYAQHSLKWLSQNWPGIPYPYEKTTVVQGYAGMEYPMMANDESYDNPIFSRFVAEHEIAHTYMPFYMGINETRYGMMDEGWATTFEYLIGTADLGPERAEQFFKQFRVQSWIKDPSAGEDIPIITPGDALTGPGFGNNEYGKAALGYLALKNMLGDDEFKKCLHAFMNRWNGKHPIPWDFFNTVNDVSGKNLNWFWSSWYFSPTYIDLAIESVKSDKGSSSIVINNIGGMPAPVKVIATYADGSTESFDQTSKIWEMNQKQSTIKIKTSKPVKSLKLSGGIWMDADESNNEWISK
jgi:hypothetical protein